MVDQEASCEDRIQKQLLEAKRNAFQASEHGVITMEKLDEQEEILRSVEDTLEANEHILTKSMKSLRGMTWTGYLYNHCVDTKGIVFGTSGAVLSNNNPNQNIPSQKQDLYDDSNKRTGNIVSKESDELEEISAAVATLHKMSIEIGNQLEMQNSTIENITEKTEKVTDQTLAVTIRASQLNNRSRNAKPKYGGIYQFVDTVTGQYLAVHENRLVLTSTLNRATYFNCFVKESNLYGVQNEKNQKYLGCALLGHIIAESGYFGTQEECYIDFKAKETGILFIARHWGTGGWLRRPPVPEKRNTASSSTAATDSAAGTDPASAAAVILLPLLTETTTSITDKVDTIMFRTVKIQPKERVDEK